MTLMVKCKNCSEDIPSRLQLDENSFKTENVNGNLENCTQCGLTSAYNKDEYYFK